MPTIWPWTGIYDVQYWIKRKKKTSRKWKKRWKEEITKKKRGSGKAAANNLSECHHRTENTIDVWPFKSMIHDPYTQQQ